MLKSHPPLHSYRSPLQAYRRPLQRYSNRHPPPWYTSEAGATPHKQERETAPHRDSLTRRLEHHSMKGRRQGLA